MFDVTIVSLPRKAIYRWENTYGAYVASTWWVLGVLFQLHHSHGGRGTDKKLLQPANKLLFIIYRFQKNCSVSGSCVWSLGAMCQLYYCNGRQDTDEKLLRTPSKMPFIIDRFQPTLHCLWSMRRDCSAASCSYITAIEGEIYTKNYVGFHA
jgi:hypothetical protein